MKNSIGRKQIIEVIKENYTDPDFNVNKLARILKINRSFLFKKVIIQCNCNPKQLIENKRLAYALELLSVGEKVTYVAYKTGFNNVYNLRRTFKKRFNFTPSKFREICFSQPEEKAEIIQNLLNKL